MFRVVERKPVNVYMSGEVLYGQQFVGSAETREQAEEMRLQRHKRRGTDLAHIYIEEAEE